MGSAGTGAPGRLPFPPRFAVSAISSVPHRGRAVSINMHLLFSFFHLSSLCSGTRMLLSPSVLSVCGFRAFS